MSMIVSRAGVDVDWGMDLPFDNHVAIRFQINSGLEIVDHTFNSSENTHLWLLFSAASLLESQTPTGRQISQLIQPWKGGLDDDFHDTLCRALWDADKRPPFNDALFNLIPTWKSHFYDPDTRTNWTGQTEPTALSEGVRFYNQSQQAYQRRDWKAAGYNLGLSLHYLTDLTQPMHAANFTWFDSQNFGYHTGFERYAKRLLGQISVPTVYNPLLNVATPPAFFHETARRSKDTYFARIVKPEWTGHYDDGAQTDAVWKKRVGAIIPVILQNAVQITAQFLLMWFKDATSGD